MSEIFGRVRVEEILTFLINERIFGKSENRFGTIPG